jgi:hypothetical protein
MESTEDELSAYTGLYTYLTSDLELYMRDGELWVQDVPKRGLPGQELPPPDPPVRAARYAEDRLVILDEPMKDSHVEILRDRDGVIKWLRVAGRVFAREN